MKEETAGLIGETASELPVRQEPLERVLELLGLGGPVAMILIAMSVVALTIILAKLWQFSSVRIGNVRARMTPSGCTEQVIRARHWQWPTVR